MTVQSTTTIAVICHVTRADWFLNYPWRYDDPPNDPPKQEGPVSNPGLPDDYPPWGNDGLNSPRQGGPFGHPDLPGDYPPWGNDGLNSPRQGRPVDHPGLPGDYPPWGNDGLNSPRQGGPVDHPGLSGDYPPWGNDGLNSPRQGGPVDHPGLPGDNPPWGNDGLNSPRQEGPVSHPGLPGDYPAWGNDGLNPPRQKGPVGHPGLPGDYPPWGNDVLNPPRQGGPIYHPGLSNNELSTPRPLRQERPVGNLEHESKNSSDSGQSGSGKIETCIRNCPTTSEYSPVCGSNGITYSNPGRLECAQKCGVDVQLSSFAACSAPETDNIYPTLKISTESSSIQTTLNTTEKPDNGNGATIETGGNESKGNRGTNGYKTLPYPTLNTSTESSSIQTTSNTTEKPDNGNGETLETGGNESKGNRGTNGYKTQPSVLELVECLQLCPITTNCEPVCGDDGITYVNPGRLACSQICGIDVKAVNYGPCASANGNKFQCPTPNTEKATSCPSPACFTCPTPTITLSFPSHTLTACPNINSPITEDTGKSSLPLSQCLFECPITEEYIPVCGTDNITYPNIAKLECSKRCGVDVSVVNMSECTNGDSTTPSADPPVSSGNTESTTVSASGDEFDGHKACLQRCDVSATASPIDPVCGTDDYTYLNEQHIDCVRECGSKVQLKSRSPCLSSSSSTERIPNRSDAI